MGGRRWTQDELQILESMSGAFTVATIAKKLGRSFESVNIKLNRMGMSGFVRTTDLLTMNQVSLMLGVERRTMNKKWRDKGLHIMKRGRYRVVRQNDLIRYLRDHPEDWNAANVNDDSLIMQYSWYKDKRKTDTKSRYFWTPDEISKLHHLRRKGYSVSEIAEQMGRSQSSIKYKLYIYGRK